MEEAKSGELAFLPSDITLLRFKKGISSAPSEWVRTREPSHVLIIEEKGASNEIYTKILYNGKCWMAREQDLYPLRNQS